MNSEDASKELEAARQGTLDQTLSVERNRTYLVDGLDITRSKTNNVEVITAESMALLRSVNLKQQIDKESAIVLDSRDVLDTIQLLKRQDMTVTTTMLDPWYNKGVGGVRNDYESWLSAVVKEASEISQHVFVWGFPEIVHKMLDHIPENYELVAWLTWYYKNVPSVIRGWRSAQLACLHLGRKSARLYPEHFLNEKQKAKQKEGKLRYMPGPPSVIESAVLIGWAGKKEQIGRPAETAQKPMKVIEPLIMMTTKEKDVVLDPMCGTGTTGAVCMKLGRRVILCDKDQVKVGMVERRLAIKRLTV